MANPLDQVASWPATAAVGVASAAGVLASTGPDDRPYAWASVTKLLVALAALDGVQRGLLDLDEPAGPPGATIRHLLSHASGLGFDGDAILSPPGRRRIYSNRGIEIVADLLADRSGQPFERLLAEVVCLPLEMADTRLEGSPAWGAVGPLRDLMTLAIELIRPRLVREDLLAEATRTAFGGLPGVLPGFGRQPHCDWGLGFEIRDAKEPHWTGSANSARTFGHFGRSGSFLWVDPAARIACACLADRDFGDWAKQAWPRLSDDVLASYAAKDLSGRTVLPQPPASITPAGRPHLTRQRCRDRQRPGPGRGAGSRARRVIDGRGKTRMWLELSMSKPAGEIGHLRNEELPPVRVIVPPDFSGRVFEDDLDPGEVVFDGSLTAMLVWHERYPLGRGWRSGWVLSYDTDGQGNPDDYIVGLSLADVDAAVAQAREYLRSVGYPAGGWPPD